MNNRIAKKILTCVSTLHTNRNAVLKARKHYINNQEWFNKQSIYLIRWETDNEDRKEP